MLELLDFQPSGDHPTIILMRHAHSKYTGKFPDISESGEQQVDEASPRLQSIFHYYNAIELIGAGSVRGRGTQHRLGTNLGLFPNPNARGLLAPLHIKVPDDVFLREEEKNDPNHTYKWILTSPEVYEDNPLTEGRKAVEDRSITFLSLYPEIRSAFSSRPLTLAVTHLEPMAFFALSAFPGERVYPIDNHEAPKNMEPLVMEYLGDSTFNVLFRDIMVTSRLNTAQRMFERV